MKHPFITSVSLGIVCLFLSFTGCRTDSSVPPTTEPKTTVHVAIPYDNPYNEQVVRSLLTEFVALQPDVEVELEALPYQDYEQTLEALATKGEQPDLMLVDNAYIPALSRRGTLATIDVWLNETGLTEALDPQLLAIGLTDEGSIYGCPWLCWTYVMYCNLRDISLEECQQMTNWTKLMEHGQTYSNTGKKIIAIAAADTEELSYQFQELLAAEQGNLHTLRIAEHCDTLNWLQTLTENNVLPLECLDWGQADLSRRFAQGALVTMLNRTTQVPYLQSLEPSFEWTVLPFPLNQTGNHCLGIQSLVVSAEAESAAYDLLAWMMQPAQVQTISEKLNSIPVRSDVSKLIAPENNTLPALTTSSLQYGGNFRSWPVISTAVRTGVRDLLMQNKTAQTTLLDMQYTIDRYYMW